MMDISEKDKMGMKSLIASIGDEPKKKKQPLPKPRPPMPAPKRRMPTQADIDSGIVSEGDANDEIMMRGFKNGGMIDRAAIRGKTKGKIC